MANNKFYQDYKNRKMAPILYKHDTSPPARAVMMVADLLGLQYETREVNPVLRDQDTTEMTEKNPMRTVPLLEDGDFCLADSHAIILYLMEKYGKPQHSPLYPKDGRTRATIHQRLFFDCGILFPRLRAVMAPTFFGRLTGLTKTQTANIDDAYRTLEAYLSKSKYLADDVMTIADVSAIATVSSLDGLCPIDDKRFPETKKWLNTMSQKEFYRKVNALGNEMLISILKTLMKNNSMETNSKL